MLTEGLHYREKIETAARAKTFWGDSREDVLKHLVAGGIGEAEANELLESMFQERDATIRGMGLKKIYVGLSLIAVAIAAWFFFIGVLHVLPVKLFFLPATAGVYGAYSVIKGSIMCMAPSSETGDIAEK